MLRVHQKSCSTHILTTIDHLHIYSLLPPHPEWICIPRPLWLQRLLQVWSTRTGSWWWTGRSFISRISARLLFIWVHRSCSCLHRIQLRSSHRRRVLWHRWSHALLVCLLWWHGLHTICLSVIWIGVDMVFGFHVAESRFVDSSLVSVQKPLRGGLALARRRQKIPYPVPFFGR